MRLFILWALVLSFAFTFAGHLFEIVAMVPNWRSGVPEEVARLREFLVHSGPGDYYLPVLFSALAFAIAAVFATWRGGRTIRIMAAIPVLVVLVYGVWTQSYFVPINRYIGKGEYDPVVLKALVNGWVMWETPRAGLLGVGLAASIFLMERFRAIGAR